MKTILPVVSGLSPPQERSTPRLALHPGNLFQVGRPKTKGGSPGLKIPRAEMTIPQGAV